MNNRFAWAASGDLVLVKKFLEENPDKINEGWDGVGYKVENTPTGNIVRFGVVTVAISSFMINPVLGAVMFCASGIPFGLSEMVYEDYYKDRHKGWTMLQFAAKEGRGDIGAYLISHGADINNNYRKIAEENGHKNFLILCDKEVDKRGKALEQANKLNAANELIATYKLKLIKKSHKLNSLREDFHQLYQNYKVLISDEDNILMDDLHQQAMKLYEKLTAMKLILDFVASQTKHQSATVSEYAKELHAMLDVAYQKNVAEYKSDVFKDYYKRVQEAHGTAAKASGQGLFSGNSDELNIPFAMKARKIQNPIGGDCFFEAVMDLKPGNNWNRQQLRKSISEELLKNPADYQDFLSHTSGVIDTVPSHIFKYDGYKDYCEQVTKDRFPVDNMEIIAFCKIYKVSCVVVDVKVNFCNQYGYKYATEANPPMFLAYMPGLKHYLPLDLPAGKDWQTMLNDLHKSGKINDDNHKTQVKPK